METCPTELITLIIQHACSDDFGRTARSLGLVSKYFRDITEPTELRTIAVAGLKQLQGVVARLERARTSMAVDGSGRTEVGIRHLFISELTAEHALASDTNFHNGGPHSQSSFWRTDEGSAAAAFYREHSDEFWRLATLLVKSASATLRALSLLSSENWSSSGDFFCEDSISPKVLGSLSGVSFPNLRSLTVDHCVSTEITCFCDVDSLFRPPTMPLLQRLHIISPVAIVGFANRRLHPLLADVHSPSCELTHLTICDSQILLVDRVRRVLFGSSGWQISHATGVRRTLPGKLRSVIFQQGVQQTFFCGTGYMNYRILTQNFVDNVHALGIDGLEAHLPTPMYPEEGKRRYELLLTEWQEQVTASPV